MLLYTNIFKTSYHKVENIRFYSMTLSITIMDQGEKCVQKKIKPKKKKLENINLQIKQMYQYKI